MSADDLEEIAGDQGFKSVKYPMARPAGDMTVNKCGARLARLCTAAIPGGVKDIIRCAECPAGGNPRLHDPGINSQFWNL